ncbi:inositol-pentakisphosphate 2-kinase [Trametes meyenii]|nr:inositol-pentakisphosphate 2-kinase [Trametes meyenii]
MPGPHAPHIAETAPHDWKYVAEGGSTIVFSYAGPPHADFDGTALRLRKRPVPQTGEGNKDAEQRQQSRKGGGEEDGEDAEGEPDDPTIVFQRRVIEQLVPREHLPRLDAVRVDRAWLQELADAMEGLRPPERRAKDRIDTQKRKAVLATDLVGGEGWAVEIKPKWGFLPTPTFLSPETRDTKRATCRFCMHAHLKSTQGEDVSLGYCPLDLYSGAEKRVAGAVHALWDAWIGSGGGVNNLRVFIKGKVLKPGADDPSTLAPLATALFPPTRSPLGTDTPPSDAVNELRDAFTRALVAPLLHTPVLRTLSTLQRTLDALDVEGLSALWTRLHPDTPRLGDGAPDPDIDEWARFVDAYACRARRSAEDDGRDDLPATPDELRYRLLAYLLSASFKDCSIILRMAPARGDAADGGEQQQQQQETTVTVIDLDVKSIDRLAKWAKLDRAIVDAYRTVAVPRRCDDARPRPSS